MKSHDLLRLLNTEIFDISGAADYLGLQRNSIEMAAIRGRIPFIHWSRKKLFCKDDLDYYIANRGQGRSSGLQNITPIDLYPRSKG